MGNTAKSLEPFTYRDYEKLPEGERLEILDGVIYDMTPSPTVRHQKVVLAFAAVVHGFFRGKECTPFVAPMDVVLDDINVVEPDVFVVCDKSKITEANITGAPDLIIEVLSPSTGLKDRREKKHLYQQHGVREYIIVNPMDETAERYELQESGNYGVADIFGWDEHFPSVVFPDLMFDLRVIFEKEDVVAESHMPVWLAERLGLKND